MGPEQVAVRADHLGLDPEAEGEPEVGDVAGDPVEPVGQLAPVDDPVAERAVVRVAVTEPAVVEDEQLDPEVPCRGGDADQPLGVEVEVGRLPVVEQDGALAIAPRAPGETRPV